MPDPPDASPYAIPDFPLAVIAAMLGDGARAVAPHSLERRVVRWKACGWQLSDWWPE